jgi:hypothetical protein
MIDKGIREIICTIDPLIGETIRLEHDYSSDGSKCSVGKDPCLNVTRVQNGYKYFCHRCHESGYFPKESLSPDQTANIVKNLKCYKDQADEDTEGVFDLPKDSIPILRVEKRNDYKISWSVRAPFEAQQWLWAYWLSDPEKVEAFNLQWSQSKQRLIFPVYKVDEKDGKRQINYDELLGWVGRNVDSQSEYAKWITNKAPSYTDRLLFILPGEKDAVIYTEDVVSAIRVHLATGLTTCALLTTTLSYDICTQFKDHDTQVLWLDGDMKSKMLKYVMQMRAKGIPLKMKHTLLDPKEYSDENINTHLREALLWQEE